jgi:hypothetical protein
MNRVLRRLFNFSAALSALLCLATSLFWAKNLRYSQDPRLFISNQDGVLLVFYTIKNYNTANNSPREFDHLSPADNYRSHQFLFAYISAFGYPPNHRWWNHLGFSMSLGSDGATPTITCPAWAIIAASSILPTLWITKRFRKNRCLKKGYCPSCGYDLRATPDRCPECGAIPTITKTI